MLCDRNWFAETIAFLNYHAQAPVGVVQRGDEKASRAQAYEVGTVICLYIAVEGDLLLVGCGRVARGWAKSIAGRGRDEDQGHGA